MNPFFPGDDQDNPIHLGLGTYVYRGFNGVDLLLVTYNDAGVPTRSIRLFPMQVGNLVEAIKELDVFVPDAEGMPLQMKTYLATTHRHDGWYSVKVYAASERDAKEICLARGWEFDGELIAEIPADKTTPAQMDEFIRRRNEGKDDA